MSYAMTGLAIGFSRWTGARRGHSTESLETSACPFFVVCGCLAIHLVAQLVLSDASHAARTTNNRQHEAKRHLYGSSTYAALFAQPALTVHRRFQHVPSPA